jgi:hypothetical protein
MTKGGSVAAADRSFSHFLSPKLKAEFFQPKVESSNIGRTTRLKAFVSLACDLPDRRGY